MFPPKRMPLCEVHYNQMYKRERFAGPISCSFDKFYNVKRHLDAHFEMTDSRLRVFQFFFLITLIDSSSSLVSCRRMTPCLSLLIRHFTFVIPFSYPEPLQFQDMIFINHFFKFLAPFPGLVLFPFFPPPHLFPALAN